MTKSLKIILKKKRKIGKNEENIKMDKQPDEDDEYFLNIDESIYTNQTDIVDQTDMVDDDDEYFHNINKELYLKIFEVKSLKSLALDKLIAMYWSK